MSAAGPRDETGYRITLPLLLAYGLLIAFMSAMLTICILGWIVVDTAKIQNNGSLARSIAAQSQRQNQFKVLSASVNTLEGTVAATCRR